MSEVKLPLDLNPIVNTYHHLAHPLGIIGGNIPSLSVWFPLLANKYINCQYYENPKISFELYASDPLFLYDRVIEQVEFRINGAIYDKLFDSSRKTFIANIKKALDKGLYIQGHYNEKYISAMRSYLKRDFCHDYLIYGYSDNKKCFYASGYTSTRYYQEYQIPFSEYYDSIFQQTYKHMPLRFMHLNKDKTYETDYSVVLRDLNHYLNSTAFIEGKDKTFLYGLSVWKKLIEYLTKEESIDIRFTKIFMEHHKLMNMRLEYFAKESMIDLNIYQQYRDAYDISNKVYLSSIKYNLAPKQSLKDNLIKLITKVMEIDREILPLVITQIEEKTNVK